MYSLNWTVRRWPESPALVMPQANLFEQDQVVVKANDLVKAKSNFTRLEHRVIAMMIARLKKSDQEFKLQRVYVRDLLELSGTNYDAIYERMEDVCDKLLNQQIKIRTRDASDRRVYQGYNYFETCRYVEGSGYIEARFTQSMKPFLLELKERFTMYQLQHFMKLTSSYSMRIYEILKMRADLEHLNMTVDELREVLSCEHSYERFTDFKRHVLERAKEEIHEKTDLAFRYFVKRKGRTPTHVHFRILRNSEAQKRLPEETRSSAETRETPPKPRFDVQRMVLDELSQDELDRFTISDIQSAVKTGTERAEASNGNASEANKSVAALTIALETLRA